jgi:hypothetical protein
MMKCRRGHFKLRAAAWPAAVSVQLRQHHCLQAAGAQQLFQSLMQKLVVLTIWATH